MDARRMRAFWDRRAREDAFHFIDNRLRYRTGDRQRFWTGGEEDLEALLGAVDVAIRPTDSVLEIGCGVGRMTRPIAARARHVRALDVSGEMLKQARALNPQLDNVTWVKGDGTSLAGIEDASVDACLSHVVFQHIPDPAITLGYVVEMGRVLRPGGWSAFQVSNDPRVHRASRWTFRDRMRRRLLALVGHAPRGQESDSWLGSAVDLGDLEDAAARAEMVIERSVGAGTQFCFIRTRRL